MNQNIYVLGTTIETGELIKNLVSKFTISGVLTLKSSTDISDISGNLNLRDLLSKLEVPVYDVHSYNLNNENDFKLLAKLKIDILIVYGWQRLVPAWLLNHVSIAAIGVHGSSDGITAGRGRSPQNWALILGATRFYFSLFQLSDGIDSGPIISSASYSILPEDNIRTLYKKLTKISSELIYKFLSDPTLFLESSISQEGEAYYYPKRVAADGVIDWRSNSESIQNLVRGITKPYPGAFTWYRNQKIFIWKVKKIVLNNPNEIYHPGIIISKKDKYDFCISTGDGLINVLDYTFDSPLEIKEGESFTSSSEYDVISNIIQRHYQTYPNLKISPRLINYLESLDVRK